MQALKDNLVWILVGLVASSLVGAASAAITAQALAPGPVEIPAPVCPEPKTDERLVALLTELAEAERAKEKRRAQQAAASRRYRRPMHRPSKPTTWSILPKSEEASQ